MDIKSSVQQNIKSDDVETTHAEHGKIDTLFKVKILSFLHVHIKIE